MRLDIGTPAVQLVLVTVALMTVLGVWVRGHSSLPGKQWFLLTSVAMSWWLFAVGLELSTGEIDCALLIGQGAWLGIVLLPTFWAFFLYEYALGARVPRSIISVCGFVAPIIIVAAVATNRWHLAFYGPETRLVSDVTEPYLYFDHGPLFYAAISYLYVVIMSAIFITGRAVQKANPAVRSFFLKLFAGTMIPVVANLCYLIGGFRLFGSDPTPFSFALSLVLVVWLIADNRWVDINAIARELMFYNSSDPVFVLDPEGRVIETNPAATTLLTMVEPGANCLFGIPQLGLLLRSLTQGKGVPEGADVQLGDRHFAVRAHEISLGKGQKKLGWALALLDVTTQKIAAQKAIAAEQMQTEFLATVSHELRTPLTVINGSLRLLSQGAGRMKESQRNHLFDRATSNVATLTKLVNDLIDTQSLSSGEFRMDFTECELGPLVAAAAAGAESLQPEKGIRIISEGTSARMMVRVDRDRMAQVLGNVLSNAVKFSNRGGTVEISVLREGDRALITVADAGCGIPPGAEDRVFAQFSQLDASDTKSAYGSGLGLHISRQILDRHGGSIRYVSAPGVGTTFTVSLPLVA